MSGEDEMGCLVSIIDKESVLRLETQHIDKEIVFSQVVENELCLVD